MYSLCACACAWDWLQWKWLDFEQFQLYSEYSEWKRVSTWMKQPILLFHMCVPYILFVRFVLINLCHLFWCESWQRFMRIRLNDSQIPTEYSISEWIFLCLLVQAGFLQTIFAFPLNSIDNSPCARCFCFHSINRKSVMIYVDCNSLQNKHNFLSVFSPHIYK